MTLKMPILPCIADSFMNSRNYVLFTMMTLSTDFEVNLVTLKVPKTLLTDILPFFIGVYVLVTKVTRSVKSTICHISPIL